MSTIYRIKMSDGTAFQKSAQSAGEAIYAALQKHTGRTVAECHSGLTDDEAAELRKQGQSAMPGAIFHDIPFHKPMEPEPEVVE